MSGRKFYVLLGTIEMLGCCVITQSETFRLMFLLNGIASFILCVLSDDDVPVGTLTIPVVDEREDKQPSPFGIHTAEETK